MCGTLRGHVAGEFRTWRWGKKIFFIFFGTIFLLAPITGLGPGVVEIRQTSADQVIKIFESNLGIEHLTFGI